MEAANRGASEAGQRSIALGISLPLNKCNECADPELHLGSIIFSYESLFLYHPKAVFVFSVALNNGRII